MLNGILHQRLQDEVGHVGGERSFLDAELRFQPVGEADALDLQVLGRVLQFFFQGYGDDVGGLQRDPQQVAEQGDHPIRLGGIGVGERRY